MKNNQDESPLSEGVKAFDRFQELFTIVKTTKKYDIQLEKDALDWFKSNFNAPFGSLSRCDQKDLPFLWHYSTGLLIFCVNGIGSYHYKFIIKAVMFNYFKHPAYIQGFKHVRHNKKHNIKCNRDANPFPEFDFYNRQAWDCGYICGIYNKHIIPTT